MANDRLINSTQGDSIITELRAMNTNLADIKSAMSGEVKVISEKDVNFYDYDGSRVASYTAAEFADLTALPDNPTHEGLTSQGWNWSLADAKTYVANYGKCNVGQTYTTSDGKTRIYITLMKEYLHPYLGLFINGSVNIDWGDGSSNDTMTGSSSTANVVYIDHTYSESGEYIISIEPVNGSTIGFYGNGRSVLLSSDNNASSTDIVYINAITKIEIGNGVSLINYDAFGKCSYLKEITLPLTVSQCSSYIFEYCYSLKFLVIPKNITLFTFSTFKDCYSLENVIFPNSIETFNTSSLFNNCRSLKRICLPNSCTTVDTVFCSNSSTLLSIIFTDSVTSINDNAFNGCTLLESIKLPSNLTSIGVGAFINCNNLKTITFSSSLPPTFGNGAFTNIPASCIIYVPQGSLSAYQSASNKPNGIYVEY